MRAKKTHHPQDKHAGIEKNRPQELTGDSREVSLLFCKCKFIATLIFLKKSQ